LDRFIPSEENENSNENVKWFFIYLKGRWN
jgi:hypothetical protein